MMTPPGTVTYARLARSTPRNEAAATALQEAEGVAMLVTSLRRWSSRVLPHICGFCGHPRAPWARGDHSKCVVQRQSLEVHARQAAEHECERLGVRL